MDEDLERAIALLSMATTALADYLAEPSTSLRGALILLPTLITFLVALHGVYRRVAAINHRDALHPRPAGAARLEQLLVLAATIATILSVLV
jgi:hypothetical protein